MLSAPMESVQFKNEGYINMMNRTEMSVQINQRDENEKNFLLCAGNFFILFLSLCINFIAIVAIAINQRLQTSTNCYELSTFIFIAATLLIQIWMSTSHLLGQVWTTFSQFHSNDVAIKFLNVFIVLHETTKIVERYFGLSQPLHSRAKSFKSRAVKRTICIWILTGVVNLPVLLCNNSSFPMSSSISNDEYEQMLPTGIRSAEMERRVDKMNQENFFMMPHTQIKDMTEAQNSTQGYIMQDARRSMTLHAMCAAHSSISPYVDFSFLYTLPLLLNAIFFIITVRQLRNVCDGVEYQSSSWKLSKTTGLRYKTQKCQPLSVSEIPSSGTTNLRVTNYPSALSVVLQNANAENDCKDFNQIQANDVRPNPCLRNHLYTMIFPSITFLAKKNDVEIPQPHQTIMHAYVRANRHELNKQMSTESAVSCVTTISTSTDDVAGITTSTRGCSFRDAETPKHFKPTKLWKNRIRAVKNLALTTVVFGVKWLPYHVARMYFANNMSSCVNKRCSAGSLSTPSTTRYIQILSGIFLFIITISSPILLCVCSKPFCSAFVRVLTYGRFGKRNLRQSQRSASTTQGTLVGRNNRLTYLSNI